MSLYPCELCGCVTTEAVCDRCFEQICEEREAEETCEERHVISELTARAALGLQLNNPL